MDVAIVHPAPAASIPIEVHLRDDEPSTAQDLYDMADMAAAACPLHTRLEDSCRPHRRAIPGPHATRAGVRNPVPRHAQRAKLRLITAGIPCPPRTHAELRAMGIAREVGHTVAGMS